MHRQQARAAKILTLRLQGLEDLTITGRTGWTVIIMKVLHSGPDFLKILRNVFRKKRYYVGKIPTWEDPPPPLPQYGNFFDEIPFFSEDVPKQKILK